jgi:hypothetical protein
LPNEFLQNDELSVDTIVKKFAKPLHVSAPSLPKSPDTGGGSAATIEIRPWATWRTT